MKPDEAQFMRACLARISNHGDESQSLRECREFPRELINDPSFGMHHKRAWAILAKWARKGWYEYGVTLDLGWITRAGNDSMKKLISA